MKKDDEPIIVEQVYNATIDNVWKSITEIDRMRQWYFNNIPSFKAEVGFKTQFSVKSHTREFLHLWVVTEVVPNKKISYNWKYDGLPGDSWVVFELSEQADGTGLKLTHNVRESFPDDIPEFSRESGLEGWKYFIGTSLKKYLEA